MPVDIDYDERGQPRIKRQPYGNAGASMFNRRAAPAADQRMTPSQGTAGTSMFNGRLGTGGASPARTEARFQPPVDTGPTLGQRASEFATRAGVAGSMLGRQAGSFIDRLSETSPAEAGAAVRSGISATQEARASALGRAARPIIRGLRAGGEFLGGLAGMGDSGAQARTLGPTARETTPRAVRGDFEEAGGPAPQPLRAEDFPEMKSQRAPTEFTARSVPEPGTGYFIGPSGRRVDVGTPRGQGQQAAQPQVPAQRGPAAFQETPIPPMPQPPQFGTVRGRGRDNPFAQSQAFINDMTRYLGQLSQRKAALGERARRSTSAAETEKHRKEMAKLDKEIAKFDQPKYKMGKRKTIGGAPDFSESEDVFFYDENDPENIIRMPQREETESITRTPEEIAAIDEESREALSGGNWTLEEINERRLKEGYPPFLG